MLARTVLMVLLVLVGSSSDGEPDERTPDHPRSRTGGEGTSANPPQENSATELPRPRRSGPAPSRRRGRGRPRLPTAPEVTVSSPGGTHSFQVPQATTPAQETVHDRVKRRRTNAEAVKKAQESLAAAHGHASISQWMTAPRDPPANPAHVTPAAVPASGDAEQQVSHQERGSDTARGGRGRGRRGRGRGRVGGRGRGRTMSVTPASRTVTSPGGTRAEDVPQDQTPAGESPTARNTRQRRNRRHVESAARSLAPDMAMEQRKGELEAALHALERRRETPEYQAFKSRQMESFEEGRRIRDDNEFGTGRRRTAFQKAVGEAREKHRRDTSGPMRQFVEGLEEEPWASIRAFHRDLANIPEQHTCAVCLEKWPGMNFPVHTDGRYVCERCHKDREYSMVGRRMFGNIDRRLRDIMGVDQPFGGLHVILVGDNGQLPPVKDATKFVPKETEAADGTGRRRRGRQATVIPGEATAVSLYEQFRTVVKLDQPVRQSAEDVFYSFLQRLRYGTGKLLKETGNLWWSPGP